MTEATALQGPEQIEAEKQYTALAVLSPLIKISVMSLRAAGVQPNALIVDISSVYPSFLKHWRSSGHLGELVEIELDIPHSGNTAYSQADANRERPFSGSVDVVTSNLAMYHLPPAEQPKAHIQIKSLLKPQTGIYTEITRGKDNKRGIHYDDVLIGRALEKVMGQEVTVPQPIHYPYTIDSATAQLPSNFGKVYMYRQSSEICLTTNREIDMKLDCHRTVRDLYVTSNGQVPTPDQHQEAIEIAIGDKIRLAREGIKPIIDYVDEALFLASDSPIDTTNFNHRFTTVK